jgi:predicted AAA+ superfamily ATPase
MLSIEELIEMNHWWKLGKVKPEFVPPYKRPIFKELHKYLKLRQIIGIIGLRRVGKTTLFYQLIDLLIKDVNPLNILYFSFDEKKAELREIFKLYEEQVLKKKIDEEKIFVFLDEIQKLDDWQNKIKVFYDLYPNIKFFVSGSASLNIMVKGRETLAGRIFYFHLDMLSFEEFLELKQKNVDEMKKRPELWKKDLKIELNNYLLRPFPEIVNAPDDLAKRYIKEAIIEKVIHQDMKDFFEVRELEVMENLIRLIATQPGMIINLDDLSKDLGISRQTLSNYIYYLECSFIVSKLRNFRGSFKASSRKLKKYYLSHPSLALALAIPEAGRVAENLVLFKTKAEYYWRQHEKEVDFILKDEKILPVEVKYKPTVKPKELEGLLKFMDVYKAKKAIVITEEYEDEKNVGKHIILFKPLWKWLIE